MIRSKIVRAVIGATSLVVAASFGHRPANAQGSGRSLQIVAFGDSLTAGFRLERSDAFPAKLERALMAKGYDVTVTNAGVSGDTSGSGLGRLARDVPKSADLIIVEFGANDILRGIPPDVTERNLDAILNMVRSNGSDVVLAGMIAPPGMGNAFSRSFGPLFVRLAKKHGATLYPFFLDGVATRPLYNLDDGIHPNAAGVDRIVEGILPLVSKRLDHLS